MQQCKPHSCPRGHYNEEITVVVISNEDVFPRARRYPLSDLNASKLSHSAVWEALLTKAVLSESMEIGAKSSLDFSGNVDN